MWARKYSALKPRVVKRLSAASGRSKGTASRTAGSARRPAASSAVAQRPAIRIPRPIAAPWCRQSIQPIVIGQAGAERASAARKASMSGTRSLSIQIQGEGIGRSPTSTSRM